MNDKNIDPKHIVLLGKSIGSGLAVEMAKRNPDFAGLILLSPLLSAFRVVMNTNITWPADIFANIDKIGKISMPTLIIHGRADSLIEFYHGEKLYNQSGSENKMCLWIDEAGHNDIEGYYTKELFEKYNFFLTQIKDIQDQETSG